MLQREMHNISSQLHKVYLLFQFYIDQLFFGFLHPLQLPRQPLHLFFQQAAVLSALPGFSKEGINIEKQIKH